MADRDCVKVHVSENGQTRRATLQLGDSGVVTLSGDDGAAVALPVKDFRALGIEERNCLCSSVGERVLRFICPSRESVLKILEYIGQYMKMTPVPGGRYKLEPVSCGPNTFEPYLTRNKLGNRQISNFLRNNLMIDQECPPKTPVTLENMSIELLYNADVNRKAIFSAFKTVIPTANQEVSYTDMKKQWELLTPGQFAKNKELRRLITFLEKSVNAREALFTRYENPHLIQKRAFDIALACSLYDWDGAAFSDELIDILLPFLDAYVCQFGETDLNCETEVFSLMIEFWSRFSFAQLKTPTRQTYITPILAKACECIGNVIAELLDLLAERHVYSLEFLREDYSTWFCHFFSIADVQTLWISALSFGDWQKFFSLFAFALIANFATAIEDFAALSSEEFSYRFSQLKGKANIRTLLNIVDNFRFAIEA